MANVTKTSNKSGSNSKLQHSDVIHPPTTLFFAKKLPWQNSIWHRLSHQLSHNRLPHALLVAGMAGLGKRHLVWQFIAYALCDSPTESVDSIDSHNSSDRDSDSGNDRDSGNDSEQALNDMKQACGHCQSCLWLKAGTHPNLRVLPYHRQPMPSNTAQSDTSGSKKTRNKKTSSKKPNQRTLASSPTNALSSTIKIDDIRGLSSFLTQHSQNVRFCVLDNADTMTIAASNALLKSLEEPISGVYFVLISDNPAKLLPTIISRVQRVAVSPSFSPATVDYIFKTVAESVSVEAADEQANTNNEQAMSQHLHKTPSQKQIEQALRLVGGAPLYAKDMLQSLWFAQRENWLKTWQALYLGKRSATAASDFWQQTLPLEDFLTLSGLMLDDMARIHAGMDSRQRDINWHSYQKLIETSQNNQLNIRQSMNEIRQALQQNVQEKLSYDKLLHAFTDKT